MAKHFPRIGGLMASAALLLLCSTHAFGHESPPTGLISIQASASQEVETDTMVAQLAVEAENRDPKRLAEDINQTMSWAQDLIQKHESITLIGGNYNSHPVYDKRIFKSWRGSQQITLKSRDSAALGTLVGQLQEKILVKSLGYQVSPDRLRQTQDQLILEAIDQFKHRAKLVQARLGAPGFIVYRLDINTNAYARPLMAQSRMVEDSRVSASAIPATLNPGQQTIQVNASGSIQIRQ